MSVVAAQTQTSSSRSPSRRSLGDKISALGARLSRTLSHADESHEEDQYSIDSPPSYYKSESLLHIVDFRRDSCWIASCTGLWMSGMHGGPQGRWWLEFKSG